MHLSSSPELRETALFILDALLVILSIAGATLWGYLFMGNTFERCRHSFLAADTHYVSKAFARAVVSLSFLCLIAAGIAALFAPEHAREIAFLTFRTTALIAACIAVISLCSYLLDGAYIGVVVSIVFMMFSFSAHMGLFFLMPMWLIPRGGEASLSYSCLMLSIAAFLFIALLASEKLVKRG